MAKKTKYVPEHQFPPTVKDGVQIVSKKDYVFDASQDTSVPHRDDHYSLLGSCGGTFEAVIDFDNIKTSINVIEKFLIIESEWTHTDGVIREAISEIISTKGSISIKSLLTKFSISRDSFEKKFRKQVGTSPKKFSNIVRFRNLFENNDEITLTEKGLNAGYYDQSHFIKDFKAITGKKPSDIL
ncbi:helix-turn-helix domain-containing protein [Flavobacterium sp.]|uniref:helix-turn-helix domain-containing protein n=1 Tax=Flavobacterium sp. TaxID=239 RepID=UPI003C46F322